MTPFPSIFQRYDEEFTIEDYFYDESYFDTIQPDRPLNILEIASGTGRIASLLVKKGHRLTCLDVDREALEICKKKINASGHTARFIQSDIHLWKPDDIYDLILFMGNSVGIMRSITDFDILCLKIKNSLVKNGRFLITLHPQEMFRFALDKEVKSGFFKFNKYVECQRTVKVIVCKQKLHYLLTYYSDGFVVHSEEIIVSNFSPDQITTALAKSFETVSVFSGFNGESRKREDELAFFIAERKS